MILGASSREDADTGPERGPDEGPSPSTALDLDVVIVTYQSASHLSSCLGSLPDGVRPVVVDNNSADGSAALAAKHGAEVVRNSDNRGFAAAANQGAALGHGDLLLFLNPDARIEPSDLHRLVTILRADPSAAVAGPRLRRPDGSEQRPWWPFPSARHSWSEAAGLHRLTAGPTCRSGGHGRAGPYVPFVVGACFLVRRAAFEALGGFDEEFWLYGEEADFCRRAADAGWLVRYVPEAHAVHVGGASAESVGTDLVREYFLLGTDRFILKHGGRAALVSHRLALLVGSAGRVAALAFQPGDPVGDHRRRLARRQIRVLAVSPATLVDPAARPVPRTTPAETPRTGGRLASGLVVCSLEAWDETWRRNQFLVRELLAQDDHLRVLFVEPPVDVLYEVLHSRRLHCVRRSGRPPGRRVRLRPVTPDGRLWALRPRKILPRVVGPWTDRSLTRQVRRAATTLGLTRPTLWINDSAYAPLVEETRWPALYDITDDWLEATCTPRERQRRHRRERSLLARAAVVVACSPALVERRLGQRAVRLIPNAVDADHLSTPQPRPADLPDGPYAVYVGTLHEDRLDVDLLVDLARSIRTTPVVLVGPDSLAARSRERLLAEGNLRLMGARPYRAIPGYLQHAAVIVVPHVVSTFTESLDPIKGYEILAVGRPAVVTPVAGLRDLGPPVRCACGAAFVETVRILLSGPPESAPQDVPGWAARATLFGDALRDAQVAEPGYSIV